MRSAVCTFILFAFVAAGCGGDDRDGRLAAEPDCADAIVEVGDVARREPNQAEVARLILGSLGMGQLADEVPEPVPTSGSDGFVALDQETVVYAEDGRTLGVFSNGGGSVCHSLKEEYYRFP
jgi:hypothetical protein